MRGCRVRFLLMGGQACVLYGGSEFSRDTDLVILPDQTNLDALHDALKILQAEEIAVPHLTVENLKKGHAVHFRCKHPEAMDMRVDIMSVLRNARPFEDLWQRRTTIEMDQGVVVDIISMQDLVAIKKTQRDKDWTHIRRLVEAHYRENTGKKTNENILFWLLESRTPEILREVVGENAGIAESAKKKRSLLRNVPDCTEEELRDLLMEEEKEEKKADREYWQPLLKELEGFRHLRERSVEK
jgi:hypothetical protein